MASYKVFVKPSAAKEIEAVGQREDRQRIGVAELVVLVVRVGQRKDVYR